MSGYIVPIWFSVRRIPVGRLFRSPGEVAQGTDARAKMHGALEQALHLFLINRGVLIAPFHNMTLVSPATTQRQVDRLANVLDECLKTLIG